MPADGNSLPLKKGDFGTSRWAGSKVRLHQPRDWAEGAWTAFGTHADTDRHLSAFGPKRTSERSRYMVCCAAI